MKSSVLLTLMFVSSLTWGENLPQPHGPSAGQLRQMVPYNSLCKVFLT